MRAKDFIPANKPRNFVAKNAPTSGAGRHKDSGKKKDLEQGKVKHKKDLVPMEGVSGLSDAEYNTVARYAKSKYPAMVIAALGRNPDGSVNVRMHDTKGLGITKEFKVRFAEPEETDIKEARRLKGADLQLKLVDRQEDDDTDLDDVVTDYYFDVYQNGQKVGHAQGDSYHGELVVKVDFNREFKLDTYHDKDHPLIQQFEKFQQQGVAEGLLGDREFNRVMPFVKRIAGEVTDYDRDEFGEELWSLLDQKYGAKFAQSVLNDLDVYWHEYSDMTGQGVAEGKSALEKFRSAAAEREKKHSDIEAKRQADAKQGKEDMKGAIDRLEKHLSKK